MFHTELIKKLLGAAGVAIGLSAICPSASAVIVKTDQITVNGGAADFGTGFHVAGAPSGSGTVKWDFTTVNGRLVAKARIQGKLYWDSPDPGCARLTIEFRKRSGLLTTKIKNVCVTETGLNANSTTNQVDVDESYADAELVYVLISTAQVINFHPVSPTTKQSDAPKDKSHNFTINSGTADFGAKYSPHAAGTPTTPADVSLQRYDNGNVNGLVGGELFWDSFLSAGCAKLIIDFEDVNGGVLKSKTVEKCGPGGNANDAKNQTEVLEDFLNGSLWQIRVRVGTDVNGSFVNVTTKVCDWFQCR